MDTEKSRSVERVGRIESSETVSGSETGEGESPISSLSPRQYEVFRWVCEGKRDREIAEILGISYRTVTEHVRAILSKLGVENRTSAAMFAVRDGRRRLEE